MREWTVGKSLIGTASRDQLLRTDRSVNVSSRSLPLCIERITVQRVRAWRWSALSFLGMLQQTVTSRLFDKKRTLEAVS